jgi:hypothetical protein
MGGENHEKREAEHLQQENGERDGACSDGWRSVGLGDRCSVDRKGKWVQAGAPSTEKIKEASALMGGGRSGLGGRSSVDRKGKAVRRGRENGGRRKIWGGKAKWGNGGK